MRKTIRITIDLPAKAARVYQALTDQAQLKRWPTEHAKVSLSEGVYELWGRYLPGAPQTPATRFVETSENRLLRLVWLLHGMDSTLTLHRNQGVGRTAVRREIRLWLVRWSDQNFGNRTESETELLMALR